MRRPFLSLLVAVAGTVAGLSLAWLGAVARVSSIPGIDTSSGVGLTVVGVVLIAVAAGSVAIHWVGIMLVGAIHALLGLLALAVPFGNPFAGGIFSPVFQITRMLAAVDPSLSEGAAVFYFSGAALVVGAFLVGAALGVRSRQLAAPARAKATAVSSGIGAASLVGSTVLLLVAGGAFVKMILVMMKYDGATAALTVVGGVLAGVAGILLRWSSIGVILAGALVLIAGTVLLATPSTAVTVGYPASYGLLLIAGATFLAAGLGGTVRVRDEVSDHADSL